MMAFRLQEILVFLVIPWALKSSTALSTEWLASSLEDLPVCPPGDLRCGDGRCLHPKWKCDGQNDCRDGSDEKDCEAMECSEKQFRCDRIRCIPVEWRCDGQSDCQDGSDEVSGYCRSSCPATHFRCPTGQCIPIHWKCDGERDCSKDGADEDAEMCAQTRTCFKNEKACDDRVECIDVDLWCDGKADCRDGSDEWKLECTNITTTPAPICLDGQFRCAEGRCISASWVCDGMIDCTGGEDETADCPNAKDPNGQTSTKTPVTSCREGDYTCADGDCIPTTWHCDGSPDCADGSDETGCGQSRDYRKLPSPPASGCKANEFFCLLWNGTGDCLPLSKVCDNHHHDCFNGTDEGPGCLTACKDNGQCSDKCYPTPTGSICACPVGYVLSADGKACADIDECASSSLVGPCSQVCHNTRGSFKCGCVEFFTLEKDGVTCKADTDPLLLYGSDSRINWITPNGQHMGLVTQGFHSFVTIGIECLEQNASTSIFYSDSEKKEIIQVNLETHKEKTVFGGMGFPEGLALDWSARNLYYVDSERQEIGVCSLRNRMAHCSKVIHRMLVNPRGIAVHPGNRYFFFTQWGANAKIERAWLDGSGRVDIATEKVLWPNAIALDFIHSRLYWIDARLNWIETAKFDGRDRRTVLHMRQSHPFGLTVLGDRLYWTDWTTHSINSALVNGSSYQVIHNTRLRPMGIIVMHGSRQPVSTSPCDISQPNPCDHICLARPGNLHTCLCHGGFQLVEGKRCVPNPVLAAAGLDGVTHAPPRLLDFPDPTTIHWCRNSEDCDCAHMEGHMPDDVCVCIKKQCEKTKIHSDLLAFGIPEVQTEHQIEPSMHVSEMERYSGSTLAAIICAVVLSVILLVAIIFLVRKYCRSWIDPLDEKGLLEDDYQPKKSGRCPSVIRGFTNPTYENVTPSASSYMVKFYKSRLTHENPTAYPESPAAQPL